MAKLVSHFPISYELIHRDSLAKDVASRSNFNAKEAVYMSEVNKLENGNSAGPRRLAFPETTIIGSVGDLARELAKGTEVPEEFYFTAGLSLLGATCSPDLTVNVGMEVDTRLYTVLLGDSYSVKKSTAMRNAMDFFSGLVTGRAPYVIHGVGSGEGLARELNEKKRLILALDELRSFVDKTKVQGSVLLPLTTSLFEGHTWSNAIKDKASCIDVQGAHLSLIGCCTTGTYENMWTQEAISIGFPNRLFLVNADAKPKVAWPEPPDEGVLKQVQTRIQQQIAKLPLKIGITPEAKEQWGQWYKNLPDSIHSKRLDTIGLKLLPLFAISNDLSEIDIATVEHVTAIMDYELRLRMLTDPIDADGQVAKLEEKIRRALRSKGSQNKRSLRRTVHADRDGVWAFERALNNLLGIGDIIAKKDFFDVKDVGESLSPEVSPA